MIEGVGILLSRLMAQNEPPPLEMDPSGAGAGSMGSPGAPRSVGLAPPLPAIGAPAGYRPMGTGGEIDSSATKSHDVVTGTGIDTSARFEDSMATQDPFASYTGDRYLEPGSRSADASSGGGEKRGWFGRLIGRGGGK